MKVCTTCGREYPDNRSFRPADGSALKSTSAAADLVGAIVADGIGFSRSSARVAGPAQGEKKKAPVAAIAAVVGTLVIGGGSVAVVMSRGSSEPQAVDFSGQMAQDPVTQDTATDAGTGDGSRPGDTSPRPAVARAYKKRTTRL